MRNLLSYDDLCMSKIILILAANPTDSGRLRIDHELRQIKDGLSRAKRRDEFELIAQWAVRPSDIRRALLDYRPTIVHFIGHGEGQAGISFENDAGEIITAGSDSLANLFRLFSENIECVFLNACYSSYQAEAIARYIPYVIGLGEISDAAAIGFAVSFYDALGAGESIEFSYKLACNAIQLAGVPNEYTPILIAQARSNVDSTQKVIDYKGEPYIPPEIHPYEVGPGINDDRRFAGRKAVLRELRSLWRQPSGKPALMLIGQRRIGKTSLLNKIQRDGLRDAKLLPILVNVQGCNSNYDFLTEITEKMTSVANILIASHERAATTTTTIHNLKSPDLDPQTPFVEFKKFLRDAQASLAGQRFLLMLDEAEEIKKLGKDIPGLLRALMQSAEYPVLLLFCGSYLLEQMTKKRDSIFYNTVQIREVSYMDSEESAEVLCKPAENILTFSPEALLEAHRLTNGHPFLLQLLGTILIRQFNKEYFNNDGRDNYVIVGDISKAANIMAQEEVNMAFEEHWCDTCNNSERSVLSAMAWYMNTYPRPEVEFDELKKTIKEFELGLRDNVVIQVLEHLTEQGIFYNARLAYRFAVPLYQRWIAWRWPPEKIRLEGLGNRYSFSLQNIRQVLRKFRLYS